MITNKELSPVTTITYVVINIRLSSQMISWINEKMKYATSEPETMTNLQNCKKIHDAVEAEMTANSNNVKDCVSSAQALIEQSIRAESVNYHMNSLLELWDTLQAALERKGEQLQERLVLDKVENAFGEMIKWLEGTEHSLSNTNRGKDLDSVISLQTHQREIANEIVEREKIMTEVEGMLGGGIEIYKSQLEEMIGRYDDICGRY